MTGPEKWMLTDEDVEGLEDVVADTSSANAGEDTGKIMQSKNKSSSIFKDCSNDCRKKD